MFGGLTFSLGGLKPPPSKPMPGKNKLSVVFCSFVVILCESFSDVVDAARSDVYN